MRNRSSARINLALYSLLLIITPFLLLQNYLQDAIGMLSDWSFYIGSLKIPFVLTAFIIFLAFLIIRFRSSFTRKKILAWLFIFGMWLLGQRISDYYLSLPFYQLQHNWHYFAYGIFAFLAYQVFSQKKLKPAGIMLNIFLMALLISTFDEIMQGFISSRVFDISDIAKDLWGALMGIIFLFFIYKDGGLLKKGRRVREQKIKDYLTNPLALLLLLMIFTFILLNISSLLTEAIYLLNTVFITFLIFVVIFFIIHATRKKANRIPFLVLFGIIVVVLGISVTSNFHKNITSSQPGMVVYKGIPIPYFDVMIFENGGFRLVDKKKSFNQTDIRFFFKKASNILLIGCGEEQKSRMGFPEDLESQFVYNNVSQRGLQVIILPTEEACRVYNRLIKEKKNVVFIIHNTR